MKTELIFATNNQHKVKEIKAMLNGFLSIKSLRDIGCEEELSETAVTLKGNSMQKAKYVFDKYGVDCFADDTGLEVDALGGRPGVYSARFAGVGASYNDNVSKLLNEMRGVEIRSARFRTVIALLTESKQSYFEGVLEGEITREPKGNSGFGYDPVFIPKGFTKTLAEMSPAEKNEISHRRIALNKLIDFIRDPIVE
jgi:XTP/dITP diphosphohydrolase